MEKTQKSCQIPEQSYLEAVFPDMKHDDEESDEMTAKIPMATLGENHISLTNVTYLNIKIQIKWKKECP